ncbi:MAG: hypothetical protein IT422_03005 [Pirellulaceae bacterium]|nr:hypothetical protein [Pirellulaceae bacterium]
METNRVEAIRKRIELLQSTGTVGQIGPFALRKDTSDGLGRLTAAIEDVFSAMGDESTIITAGVEFIGLTSDPLEKEQLVDGVCVQLYWVCRRLSVVLFDSGTIASLNDKGLRFLVAHELRHAWQNAVDYVNSPAVTKHLRLMAAIDAVESDANEYARNLGFAKDHSIKLKALGFPDDDAFKMVLKNWTTLTIDQKWNLAEFLVMHGAAWRELGSGIAADSRLFTVASLWDSVSDSQRDLITQSVRQAAIPELEVCND